MRQLFEYHPIIGYRFIPNLKCRYSFENGGYLIKTNNLGFRSSNDVSSHKKSGVNRISVFGDSYTAGDGVSNGKRYTDILEKRINNIEVFNFGLPGSGTDQQYLVYNEYAKDLKNDIVIITVLVENIIRNTSHYRNYMNDNGELVCYMKPYFELVNNKLLLRNVPPNKRQLDIFSLPEDEKKYIANYSVNNRTEKTKKSVIRELKQYLKTKKIGNYISRKRSWKRCHPFPQYKDPNNYEWKLMKKILENWIKIIPSKTILIPLPMYQYIEEISNPSDYQKRFRELADETGCILHDPLNDYKKYSRLERREFRFKNDIHPSPRGHEALADSIIPTLEKILKNKI